MIKLAARAGIIGPILFGIVLLALTILEYEFLLSLGWRPLQPLDWPSGLALGPYGWIMTLTFLLSDTDDVYARKVTRFFPRLMFLLARRTRFWSRIL